MIKLQSSGWLLVLIIWCNGGPSVWSQQQMLHCESEPSSTTDRTDSVKVQWKTSFLSFFFSIFLLISLVSTGEIYIPLYRKTNVEVALTTVRGSMWIFKPFDPDCVCVSCFLCFPVYFQLRNVFSDLTCFANLERSVAMAAVTEKKKKMNRRLKGTGLAKRVHPFHSV